MKDFYKVLFIFIFMAVLDVVFLPDVFAESVKVNGGTLEIYESGGTGAAIFDKNTNTLTLNGYNDDYILFEGFDQNTINIKLKGNNIISSGGYVPDSYSVGIGFNYNTAEEKANINIEGESEFTLSISGYYDGIYNYDGNLNINNVNMSFTDIESSGIESKNGNITITNSDLFTKNVYYGIYSYYGELLTIKNTTMKVIDSCGSINISNGSVNIDNLNYTAETLQNSIFIVNDDIDISNSVFNIKDTSSSVFFTYDGDISFKNSKIYADNVDESIFSGIHKIIVDNNSYLDIKNSGSVFYARILYTELGQISNSKMIVINSHSILEGEDFIINNCDIGANNIDLFSDVHDLEINNSNVNMETNNVANTIRGILKINNSNVSIKTKNNSALLIMDEEIKEFNEKVVLNDVTILENNLITDIVDTNVDFYRMVYSYFKEQPVGSITRDNIKEYASNEIHFVAKNLPKNISNPNTSDNIIIYIIISCISLFFILILFDKTITKNI